jgi:TctA family transporter
MEVVLEAAGSGLLGLLEPHRLMFLAIGVLVGVMAGILPGISGVAGMALLLPFTYNMDPYSAMALLLGLGSVVTTSDVLTAILFGVPGHSSANATVLEGYPMSRRGEAGRALSISYMAAMVGGLFGALILAATIPMLRSIMMFIGSPELLAAAIFGISMVAALSGRTPLRGLAAAGIGILLAMVGADPQTGTLRWTMGSLYLWDGLPLLGVVLGLFAIPELCDLAISRSSISKVPTVSLKAGMTQGIRDVFRHWFLTLRCGGIGAAVGAVPGLGAAVIGWLAYAHALRTEKDARKTFGRGDVRGLIATESANNAKEGGALIPTIAFGVPGSASMAVLLGAFLIHGLVPGPQMLEKDLDITYAMVWSVVLANIMGAALCFSFSGWFARLTTLRYTIILPIVLVIVYIGAYQDTHDWGDFFTLTLIGVLGWVMKQLQWPRPPLILGFVLGEVIERYMFISIGRYEFAWLLNPIVLVLLTMAVLGFVRPFRQNARAMGGFGKMLRSYGKPVLHRTDLFPAFLIVAVSIMLLQSTGWAFGAKIGPLIVGGVTLAVLVISLLHQVCRRAVPAAASIGPAAGARQEIAEQLHMDLESDHGDLATGEVVRRAVVYGGWLVGFMATIALLGFLPAVPLFIASFMRVMNREPWKLVVPLAAGATLFMWLVFDQLLGVVWPATVLGASFPALKVIPSL